MVCILATLLFISLSVISSYTLPKDWSDEIFLTPMVKVQLKWVGISILVYLGVASFDYNKLREWTWILYIIMLFALVGLFFTDSVQRVHRWYKIPFINMSVQPSEYAKLIVVIALSWYLERQSAQANSWKTVLNASIIVGIPFILILKQPDLGTALVLFPITLVMFYLGNIKPSIVKIMAIGGACGLFCIALLFLGIVTPEAIRPYATKVLKEYQFDRLNPNTHQQKASVTAIALGGVTGAGWRQSTYTSEGWLPTPYTDSIFPAFAEEFGLLGIIGLLTLFFLLIYRSFCVALVAKDLFGRLLSAGITAYLAMHVLVNIGMMSGFLPITGVPLILVSYGGSSILSTMTALGILQSIYSRRFMF